MEEGRGGGREGWRKGGVVRGRVGGDGERERVEHITLPFPADLGTCFSVWRLVMSLLVVISIF